MTIAGNPSGQGQEELGQRAMMRDSESEGHFSRCAAVDQTTSTNKMTLLQEQLLVQSHELQRVRTELELARAQVTELYDFAPVGYLTVDQQGNILDLNLTAATLLRKERSQLIGREFRLHFDDSSQALFLHHLDRVLADAGQQSCELTVSFDDSEFLEVLLDGQRGQRPGGPCRVVMTDITQRKRAEKALAERDKYLKLLADALPVLVAYIDTDLRYEFCNAAHEVWFGNAPSALQGQHIKDVHEPDNFQLISANLAEVFSGRRVQLEIPLEHPTLGVRHFRMILVPDINMASELQGIHCLGIDSTEQRILDQQIERRQALLARLSALSAAERAVYDLIATGKSNQFIATALDIGLRTAERRRQTILNKLQVESLAQWLQQLADVELPGITTNVPIQ